VHSAPSVTESRIEYLKRGPRSSGARRRPASASSCPDALWPGPLGLVRGAISSSDTDLIPRPVSAVVLDGQWMSRLVEADGAAAGKNDLRDRPPSRFLDR
jgi:hypothetical protein